MPANFQRFLPIILIVFVVLFIVPSILHKHSTAKGPTSATLSDETISATSIVDKAEVAYRAAHGGYTSNVADLLALDRALGKPLGDGVVVEVNASTNRQTYYAQVASGVIGLVRARDGDKLIVKTCIVLKSGSGVACPAAPTTSTTTSTTSTTSTTTTTGQ